VFEKFDDFGLTIYETEFENGYLSQGAFTVAATGSPAVNALSANVQLPAPLTLANREELGTIVRANGIPVRWTGGPATGYIVIEGSSTEVSGTGFVLKYFECNVPAAPGFFMVPAQVALFLAPSQPGFAGSLAIDSFEITRVPGSNLDLLAIMATDSVSIDTNYQ
jgi:hypothetical protein